MLLCTGGAAFIMNELEASHSYTLLAHCGLVEAVQIRRIKMTTNACILCLTASFMLRTRHKTQDPAIQVRRHSVSNVWQLLMHSIFRTPALQTSTSIRLGLGTTLDRSCLF